MKEEMVLEEQAFGVNTLMTKTSRFVILREESFQWPIEAQTLMDLNFL